MSTYQETEDQEERECGVELVYIRAVKFGKKVRCSWWYRHRDPRNKAFVLPGKVQTVNCGLVYSLREVLKYHRNIAKNQAHNERIPTLMVYTDATYIQEAMDTYIYNWRRNDWKNKKHKRIANYIFWISVNNEVEQLQQLDVNVRVYYRKLPSKCLRI